MVLFSSLLYVLFVSAVAAVPQTASSASSAALNPAPPALAFLYTSFVNISTPVDYGLGPKGDRLVIPIVGGNFTGPKLSGTIVDLGADWGLIDTRTGTFYPDTRYGFRTSDGANIFVRSTGATTATGDLHLRFIFETGSPAYFWLNNIVAVGVGKSAGTYNGGSILRIDTWYF